tara:strand:- start:7676 stop:9037 length:1362 start_codon:yes stop_codon:yes gene_type:complete
MYTEMHLSEQLQEKWKPVIEHPDLPKIEDSYKRAVTAMLLENQEKVAREEASMLTEGPINAVGGGMSPVVGGEGNIKGMDPVLISLIRRSMPNLMAYDVLGVQPMSGPTGLIFAMKSQYGDQAGEALYGEADTAFSGASSPVHNGTDPFSGVAVTGSGASAELDYSGSDYTSGGPAATAKAEALGDGTVTGMGTGGHFNQMSFSIDRVSVTAQSRALKAEYTMELAQDLKAVHGLDAESELSNILSSEITAEINREVLRTVYAVAKPGAQAGVTTKGVFDLDADADGRWSVEKYKGLLYQIEREANAIAKETRRGKGNLVICSSDVASALAMSGVLDYNPALQTNLSVDDTGQTFAGVLNGRMRVYIDPYFTSTSGYELLVVGYKGSSPYDAGIFYCPYVPLQMVRAVGENTFQPKIGFKTRYGIVANPFASMSSGSNQYYRKVAISGLTAIG